MMNTVWQRLTILKMTIELYTSHRTLVDDQFDTVDVARCPLRRRRTQHRRCKSVPSPLSPFQRTCCPGESAANRRPRSRPVDRSDVRYRVFNGLISWQTGSAGNAVDQSVCQLTNFSNVAIRGQLSASTTGVDAVVCCASRLRSCLSARALID